MAYTNFEDLKRALQIAMADAVEEATEKTFEDLFREVTAFYASPEGDYHRTGVLMDSPRIDYVASSGDHAEGSVSLDVGNVYHPAGRSTSTIYNWAEGGGLIGKGGFMERTRQLAEQNLWRALASRFG